MFNPYQQYNPYQVPVRHEIIHVNGRPGAEALSMLPNSQALVMDDTAPIVWLCQTDGAGYKTCTAFDIMEHAEVKQEDVLKSFEDRLRRLEEKMNESDQRASE